MSLNTRIKERREQLNLSRIELAEKIGVTPSAIANYENGISSPKVELLYKLFDALECDANYLYQDETKKLTYRDKATPEEFENIVKKYRSLDSYGQETVGIVLDREAERVKTISQQADRIVELESSAPKIIDIEEHKEHLDSRLLEYHRSVSAGGGVFILGEEDVEQVGIPNAPGADEGDYAIKISGNSMEPDYYDGEVALVARDAPIKYGDVGIFIIDGKAYIKEYGETELISRNPESDNIKISEYANIVCMGKVVGKIREEDMIRL